jgi:hypothetical protein
MCCSGLVRIDWKQQQRKQIAGFSTWGTETGRCGMIPYGDKTNLRREVLKWSGLRA